MSFDNRFGADGSININVIPSFGRIVQLPEQQKVVTVIMPSFSFLRLKPGEPVKEPWDQDQLISTQADMFLLALAKSSKIQSTNSTSMTMLKDQDLAEN